MRKIIDGEIVDITKTKVRELKELKSDLYRKRNEFKAKIDEKTVDENIKLFETAVIKWLEITTDLITLDSSIFIRDGMLQIKNKIEETKNALASRGIKYGLSYDDIAEKYCLDSEKTGNLLGDYKNNLINLNNIYKKAYKSIVEVRMKAVNELKNIYEFIIRLQKEKDKLKKTYMDYQRHERRLKDLIFKAKKAIKLGNENEALRISNEISEEQEKDPLKEFDQKIMLLYNQKNIYEEVLYNCEKQLEKYYSERNSKFERTIIIEPIENKALEVRKKRFWKFWKK